jgi:hypothetical protein
MGEGAGCDLAGFQLYPYPLPGNDPGYPQTFQPGGALARNWKPGILKNAAQQGFHRTLDHQNTQAESDQKSGLH